MPRDDWGKKKREEVGRAQDTERMRNTNLARHAPNTRAPAYNMIQKYPDFVPVFLKRVVENGKLAFRVDGKKNWLVPKKNLNFNGDDWPEVVPYRDKIANMGEDEQYHYLQLKDIANALNLKSTSKIIRPRYGRGQVHHSFLADDVIEKCETHGVELPHALKEYKREQERQGPTEGSYR